MNKNEKRRVWYKNLSPERKLEMNRQKRGRHLKAKYNITLDDYDNMYSSQDGLCAICGTDEPKKNSKSYSFAVDHCHSTGAVRGLLCDQCNTGLGQFRDDPDLLRNAIQYLNKE